MMHSCIPDVKLLISDNTESCIPNGKKVSYWIFLNFVKTFFEVNCFEICGICSSRKSRKSKILDQWGIESLPFTCMQSICPNYWGAIRCFGRVIVHMIFVYLPYKPFMVSQKNPSQKGLCICVLNRLRNKGPPYSAVTSWRSEPRPCDRSESVIGSALQGSNKNATDKTSKGILVVLSFTPIRIKSIPQNHIRICPY